MPNTIKAEMITLLAGGANWTKGANARTAAGKPCSALSPDAVSFDIYGALLKAVSDSGQTNHAILQKVYTCLRDNIPSDYKNRDVESWNDDVEWAEISSFLNLDFFINLRAHVFTGEALSLQGLE